MLRRAVRWRSRRTVTSDDHWIKVLEREAPQADLSKETGFDVCAVTLRTTSGQALTSYGHCDIHLQLPPIAAALAATTTHFGSLRDRAKGTRGDPCKGGLSRPRSQQSLRR